MCGAVCIEWRNRWKLGPTIWDAALVCLLINLGIQFLHLGVAIFDTAISHRLGFGGFAWMVSIIAAALYTKAFGESYTPGWATWMLGFIWKIDKK